MPMKPEFVKKNLDVSHHWPVFSTSDGLGPAAKAFYKRLASLIAEMHDQSYSLTLFGFVPN